VGIIFNGRGRLGLQQAGRCNDTYSSLTLFLSILRQIKVMLCSAIVVSNLSHAEVSSICIHVL
jgi:hypothetical protein